MARRFCPRGWTASAPCPSCAYLVHQDVGELPGIAGVDRLRKQLAAADERRPVGVAADHRSEIRPLQVEAATEIHFVDLDNAALGVFQHPHDAGEYRRGHLQTGGVLV